DSKPGAARRPGRIEGGTGDRPFAIHDRAGEGSRDEVARAVEAGGAELGRREVLAVEQVVQLREHGQRFDGAVLHAKVHHRVATGGAATEVVHTVRCMLVVLVAARDDAVDADQVHAGGQLRQDL